MKYFTSILLLLLPLSAVAGDLEDWLIDAAERGNLNGVNQMLSRGADVDTTNKSGLTALMLADGKGDKN